MDVPESVVNAWAGVRDPITLRLASAKPGSAPCVVYCGQDNGRTSAYQQRMCLMTPDVEIEAVVAEIRRLDPQGEKIATVLRSTLDQLYNGQHTGHYRWDQLHKTEKTHCGTLIEINLCREFKFADGARLDYRIAGVEVDCKYSQSMYGWMIPCEAVHHLCLLMWASDDTSEWSLGIIRIENHILTRGGNRDLKRTISVTGRNSIQWIFQNAPLQPNILLHLPRAIVDAIMSLQSGQQRIDQLFRVAQRQRIGRGVIATLGQQEDYMKRVRSSRNNLKAEGFVILGQYDAHKRIAQSLRVPVPEKGESVSVQLALAEQAGQHVVKLDSKLWRVATESDPVTKAPVVPHRQ